MGTATPHRKLRANHKRCSRSFHVLCVFLGFCSATLLANFVFLGIVGSKNMFFQWISTPLQGWYVVPSLSTC